MKREIALLKHLGQEEDARLGAAIDKIVTEVDQELVSDAVAEAKAMIETETDREARRHFCIYADQAKTNGHSFQAHFIETKVLPKLNDELEKWRRERSDFLTNVKGSPPFGAKWEDQEKRWRWKTQAEAAGMSDQYEFICSFTSRLLHATPVSMATDQKLLELHEMNMFLEYVYISGATDICPSARS
jgi:hypothetical protein